MSGKRRVVNNDVENDIPINEILITNRDIKYIKNEAEDINEDEEESYLEAEYIIDDIIVKDESSEYVLDGQDNELIEITDYDEIEEEVGEYNCSRCNITFNSIEDHIRNYHVDQEVLIETQEDGKDSQQQNIVKTEPNCDEYYIQDEQNYIEESVEEPKKTFKTIKQENCLDKDGRVYTRKEVKIDKFWTKFDYKDEEVHLCTTCNSEFSTFRQLSQHKCDQEMKSKPNKVNECPLCDHKCTTTKLLASHMRVHKEQTVTKRNIAKVPQRSTSDTPIASEKHECLECHTIFATHKSLRLHSRMHDPIKQKTLDETLDFELRSSGAKNDINSNKIREMFYCNFCDKSYDTIFKEIHMSTHTDEPTYNCSVCNKKFANQINLTMHAKVHQEYKATKHKGLQVDLPYECAYCGRRFSRPHEKVKHERIHTGEKPHICEICGKSFRVSYCLTLHMRTHTGARPYVCSHCNKRFKAHSVYNHHLLTHSEVRKYQCTFCPKAFKTAVQLAGHKNSHTKPFSCTDCNRPFATLYAVRSHMETHKKLVHNLRYTCATCGAAYARNFALRDHIKEHHGTVKYENVEIVDTDGLEMDLQLNENDEVDADDEAHTSSQSILLENEGDIDEQQLTGIDEEVVTDWLHPKK